MSLVIINTRNEAIYYLNNIYTNNENWFILSTQHSVNDYFENTNHVCHHVSEYYSNEFINEEMALISEEVNSSLINLDQKINSKLSSFFGNIQINILYTLFDSPEVKSNSSSKLIFIGIVFKFLFCEIKSPIFLYA